MPTTTEKHDADDVSTTLSFNNLGLPSNLLRAITDLGYTIPTPIQMQAIPHLLAGTDVLGQAQTGTGKTAAFALPLLAKVQVKRRATQILVLVPTRELALQVADAFTDFAAHMPELNILAIYGGSGYNSQLSMLRKGAHIVIGTPGRVMDHLRRETLVLDDLKTLILDEADEMLRMGFAEDVEWILKQTPKERQIGLFSATMPAPIKAIADTYLQNPERITVKSCSVTKAAIRQCYWTVSPGNKLDALTRVMEFEDSDGIIVFVRTKRATEELAEQLLARGINAVAINGDLVQQQRERVIEQLKAGKIKVLVATDVAARGIDVDRITHVINYDVPTNPETYTHRIGRTGRAGRTGTAILFVGPRDKFLLRNIERVTKQPLELMEQPSAQAINTRRIAQFKQRITDAMSNQDLEFYNNLLNEYCTETNAAPLGVAAALAKLLQGEKDFLLKKNAIKKEAFNDDRDDRNTRKSSNRRDKPSSERFSARERAPSRERDREPRERFPTRDREPRAAFGKNRVSRDQDMEQYRIEIGKKDGIQAKNLVGAIANTAGIEGRLIGKIKIEDRFSIIDLPKGMPRDVFKTLQKVKLSGKPMNLQKV